MGMAAIDLASGIWTELSPGMSRVLNETDNDLRSAQRVGTFTFPNSGDLNYLIAVTANGVTAYAQRSRTVLIGYRSSNGVTVNQVKLYSNGSRQLLADDARTAATPIRIQLWAIPALTAGVYRVSIPASGDTGGMQMLVTMASAAPVAAARPDASELLRTTGDGARDSSQRFDVATLRAETGDGIFAIGVGTKPATKALITTA